MTLLGVLKDALAPGKDVILVKASGANINAIRGMGPGFSGSPVYRNGMLVGSVSYGLGGDAHYGALTPGPGPRGRDDGALGAHGRERAAGATLPMRSGS